MAYQHFYSRVPSRISLYNKADGFDTFAHSAALDDAFILGELPPIYHDKLHRGDIDKIRRGIMPCVYSQCTTPSGRTVQSALSYIPLDYTGERSAYLVHSLVLTEEERAVLFTDKNCFIFNPDMFITDISLFKVTSPTASPNRNYPPIAYVPRGLGNISGAVSRFDSEIMRGFIYALFMCACGRGKNIFFRLPYDDRNLSREALNFINSVMAILPCSFREKLSFVTYITDCSQYEGFNLKCMSSACREVSLSDGVFFDFAANIVKGVPEEELRLNAPLTSFFYMLLENQTLRNEFHDYLLRITKVYGADMLDIKTLSDLVFMFWQCCGFYAESSILPNDAMVNSFFEIFERYKDALDENYRIRAYRCLERYPREHQPIPEAIFSKLRSIYPTEKTAARRVILNAVLNLIHTDTMRAKLFRFIKDNYSDESAEVKLIINKDLCRVFYGGFLQQEILEFFDKNLDTEPSATQTMVVEKMLLAIRTDSIKKQTVSILNRHYDILPRDLRIKIYNVFLEMLAECDALAILLIDLVNANVYKERDDLRRVISAKISERLDLAYRYRDPRLLPILVEKDGFCEDVVIRLIFTNPAFSALYGDYLRLLASNPMKNKAKKLIHIFRIVPEMSEAVYEKLLYDCKTVVGDGVWENLYELIDSDRVGAAALPPRLLKVFRQLILYPAIVGSMYDVFKVKYGKSGIALLKRYAKNIPEITESLQYKAVTEYTNLVDAACAGDTEKTFVHMTKLPTAPATRRDISDHIRMCSLDKNKQSEKTALLFELCINVLKGSGFRFDTVYSQLKNSLIREKKASAGINRKPGKLIAESVEQTTATVLKIATEICYAHPDYIDQVCSDNSGISRVISNFYFSYGFGSRQYLKKCLVNAPEELRELVFFAVKESKREKGTLLDRIRSIPDRLDELPDWMLKVIDKIRDIIDWFRDIPDMLRRIPDWFRNLFEKIKEIPGKIGNLFSKIFKK